MAMRLKTCLILNRTLIVLMCFYFIFVLYGVQQVDTHLVKNLVVFFNLRAMNLFIVPLQLYCGFCFIHNCIGMSVVTTRLNHNQKLAIIARSAFIISCICTALLLIIGYVTGSVIRSEWLIPNPNVIKSMISYCITFSMLLIIGEIVIPDRFRILASGIWAFVFVNDYFADWGFFSLLFGFPRGAIIDPIFMMSLHSRLFLYAMSLSILWLCIIVRKVNMTSLKRDLYFRFKKGYLILLIPIIVMLWLSFGQSQEVHWSVKYLVIFLSGLNTASNSLLSRLHNFNVIDLWYWLALPSLFIISLQQFRYEDYYETGNYVSIRVSKKQFHTVKNISLLLWTIVFAFVSYVIPFIIGFQHDPHHLLNYSQYEVLVLSVLFVGHYYVIGLLLELMHVVLKSIYGLVAVYGLLAVIAIVDIVGISFNVLAINTMSVLSDTTLLSGVVIILMSLCGHVMFLMKKGGI